jgi:Glu-tRNA(Gln) amidotransferase subunit E-like FAD-binding protein
MIHSEEIVSKPGSAEFNLIRKFLGAAEEDAQIVLWGPDADIDTAIETVEERFRLAFEGVPNETRKSFRRRHNHVRKGTARPRPHVPRHRLTTNTAHQRIHRLSPSGYAGRHRRPLPPARRVEGPARHMEIPPQPQHDTSH